jgi:hypothetical protein
MAPLCWFWLFEEICRNNICGKKKTILIFYLVFFFWSVQNKQIKTKILIFYFWLSILGSPLKMILHRKVRDMSVGYYITSKAYHRLNWSGETFFIVRGGQLLLPRRLNYFFYKFIKISKHLITNRLCVVFKFNKRLASSDSIICICKLTLNCVYMAILWSLFFCHFCI